MVNYGKRVKQQLSDVLDAARLQGMSAAGIEKGRRMIMDEFKDIWRLSLGPDDFADVDGEILKVRTRLYTLR